MIPRNGSAEYKTGETKSQQTIHITEKGKLHGMSTLILAAGCKSELEILNYNFLTGLSTAK